MNECQSIETCPLKDDRLSHSCPFDRGAENSDELVEWLERYHTGKPEIGPACIGIPNQSQKGNGTEQSRKD